MSNCNYINNQLSRYLSTFLKSLHIPNSPKEGFITELLIGKIGDCLILQLPATKVYMVFDK